MLDMTYRSYLSVFESIIILSIPKISLAIKESLIFTVVSARMRLFNGIYIFVESIRFKMYRTLYLYYKTLKVLWSSVENKYV